MSSHVEAEQDTTITPGVSISDLTKRCLDTIEMVQRTNKPHMIMKNGRVLAQICPVDGAQLLGVSVQIHKVTK